MNELYTKLIEREKAISPDAEIVFDVLYWPINVAEGNVPALDHDLEQMLLLVEAGYKDMESLRVRMRGRGEQFDGQIELLIRGGYLTKEIKNDGKSSLTVALDKASRLVSNTGRSVAFEALSGNPISLPESATLLQPSQIDPSIPIIGTGGLDMEHAGLYFIECLAMLIFSGVKRARAVRVFHGRNEMLLLQEIFYDLVLDGSEQLTQAIFAVGLKDESGNPLAATKDFSSGGKRISAVVPDDPNVPSTVGQVQTLNRPDESPKAHSDQRRLPAGRSNAEQSSIKIIAGRKEHELMLAEAMKDAKKQIVIVTPFIRRRLTDFAFKQNLREALKRGVDVIIVHGMPTNDVQFDDTQFEIERIEALLNAMGSFALHLRFVRVTESGGSTSGEHSKILICDEQWAVVTSFNWLSFQETNETGVRFDHNESVREILRLFNEYIPAGVDCTQARTEIKAPWPYSNREMSEWIYGEYNSQ